MSEKHILNVKSREGSGNGPARRCRRSGMIPAVIYGHGEAGKSISICAREFRPLAHKSIHLFDLVDESGAKTLALLKDMQFDYLKDVVVHLDFQAVKMNEKIITKVAILTIGTPIGASQGGLLEQMIHELEISCQAGKIPDTLTVDISDLAVGGLIHVSDIALPEGASALVDSGTVAFSLTVPAVVAEAAPAEAEAAPAAKPAVKK